MRRLRLLRQRALPLGRIPSGRRTATRLASVCLGTVLLAACGGASASPAPTPSAEQASPDGSAAARPASPAVVTIVSPTSGADLAGPTVHVIVSVAGARVVQQTSTNLRPDEGHVHLYVDNTLVYMQYTLQQDLQVPPGTHVLRAEFVASDHAPFSPRVVSPNVLFTVK